MIAEPDTILGELYRANLKSDGWTVDLVGDGETAWSSILSSPPDVLILDTLPDIDWVELMDRVRRHEAARAMVVVALANTGELDPMKDPKRLGIMAVLTKNRMTRERLSAILTSLLARQRDRT